MHGLIIDTHMPGHGFHRHLQQIEHIYLLPIHKTSLSNGWTLDRIKEMNVSTRKSDACCCPLLNKYDIKFWSRAKINDSKPWGKWSWCAVVVMLSFVLQGITIKPVVNALKVKRAQEKDPAMNEMINERVSQPTQEKRILYLLICPSVHMVLIYISPLHPTCSQHTMLSLDFTVS